MNKDEIISALNWFYGLEIEQVDLYKTQSRRVDDIYMKKALERIAAIEQQHVDNIASLIKNMGVNPSPVGDILGPIIGKVMGHAVGLAGEAVILKVDIAVEEKAMKDYKNFILMSGGWPDLFEQLWSHLLDEDFHTAWFVNKLKEYEALKV